MALQLGLPRDALEPAGASPDTGQRAAEEVAGYENRLSSVDGRIVSLERPINLLQWMVGSTSH